MPRLLRDRALNTIAPNRASFTGLLVLPFQGCISLGITPAESFHPSRCVHQFLLPGVEGMALRADLQFYLGCRRPGCEGVSADTADCDFIVFRMNVRFHSLKAKVICLCSLLVHCIEKLVVRLRVSHLLDKEFHPLDGVHLIQEFTEYPDSAQFLLGEEQLLFPSA